MNATQRKAVIEKLLAAAPRSLGLGRAAKRNLQNMTDKELAALNGRLDRVHTHALKLPTVSTVSQAHRERLNRRREEAVEKIRIASDKIRSIRDAPGTGIESRKEQVPSPAVTEKVYHSLVSRLSEGNPGHSDLMHSRVLWTHFEHVQKRALVEGLREVVVKWLLRFDKVILQDDVKADAVTKLISGQLSEQLSAYFQFALDRIGRDTMRLMRNHLIHEGPVSLFDDKDDAKNFIALLLEDTALSHPAFEPALLAVEQELEEWDAIKPLAKLKISAHEFEADAIVSLDGGGGIIGGYLAAEMGVPRELCWLSDGQTIRTLNGSPVPSVLPTQVRHVLVVDDVVRTGRMLERACRHVWSTFSPQDVMPLALVATTEAHKRLRAGGKAYFPVISSWNDISLPWGRDGQYWSNPRQHVFGRGSSTRYSTFLRVELDRAYSSLRRVK